MIWSLQVLRFVAALMVVYIHAAQTAIAVTGTLGSIPYGIATLGLSGVDIFFVISGVVIARVAKGKAVREFAWARFRRIVPLYLICGIPAFAVTAAFSGYDWRDVIASFLLWPATDQMTAPALGVAWTLCFEVLFYASAAIVVFDRRSLYVLLAAYGVAFSYRDNGPLLQFIGNPIIIEFLFGVAIANAPSWRWSALCLPAGIIGLLVVGALGIGPAGDTIDFLTGKSALTRVALYGIPAAFIVYGAMQVRVKESVWTYLGGASYALYLSHGAVVGGLMYIWTMFPIPADLIILIGVIASMAFGWRIHERFERPILKAAGNIRRPHIWTASPYPDQR